MLGTLTDEERPARVCTMPLLANEGPEPGSLKQGPGQTEREREGHGTSGAGTEAVGRPLLMVTYTSSCSAAANVPSCPPDKRGPGVRQFETDFCVGAQNPLLATEGIGAEKVRFLGYRTFAARQKREHMPLFHCGSGPGRLGSTRATLTRACRKAFGRRFLRKA